jgi:hypothetical protein
MAAPRRGSGSMRRFFPWLVLVVGLITVVLLRLQSSGDVGMGSVRPLEEAVSEPVRELVEMRAGATDTAREPAVNATASGEEVAFATDKGLGEGRLRVHVVEAEGQAPIAACKVVVWALDDAEGFAVTEDEGTVHETGDDGRLDVTVPADVPLLVQAGESQSLHRAEGAPIAKVEHVPPLAAGELRSLHFSLVTARGTLFYGRLIDAETGAPIAEARVTPGKRTGSEGSRSIRSDTSGLFSIPCSSIQWDSSAWRIDADGYGPALVLPELGSESPDDALTLELRRSAGLRAVVRGLEGRALVLRASADPYHLSVPRDAPVFGGEEPEWHAKLDASGAGVLEGLPAFAPLSVLLQEANEVGRPWTGKIVLEPGEVRSLEWDLRAKATILGRLLDQNGRAISDTELWLASEVRSLDDETGAAFFDAGLEEHVVQRASTAADGAFSFQGVPPGTWWVGPARQDQDRARERQTEAAPQARRVVIDAGGREYRIDLTVARGLFLRGTVLRPDGSPEVNAFVTAYTGGPPVMGSSVYSAEDGTFVVGPLADGEYMLGASGGSDLGDSDYVQARAGREGVVLRLKPAGSLEGFVVEAATGARIEASVWVHQPAVEPLTAVGGSSDQTGRFRLEGLVPGTYDIAASRPDGLVGVMEGVQVAEGVALDGLRIELTPGARVEVRCSGPSAFASFSIFSGGSLIACDGLERGTLTTCTVPAGQVRIEAMMQQHVQERTLTAAAGERVEVAFEFP